MTKNSSGVKDRAGYQNPETFAKGIYSEEALYRTLNTLIIRCPSFWEEKESINLPDYGLQTNLVKYKDYIKKRLWLSGAVKRHIGVGGAATFYYFHPINFMRYVCGDLVQEINPYEGKFITPTEKIDHEHKYPDIKVKSNHGFAPILFRSVNEKPGFSGNDGIMYAYITRGIYKPANHNGVDFGTNGDYTPIISFIYGTVWAVTWQGNVKVNNDKDGRAYGNLLIIKNDNEDKLYLLGNLSEIKVKVDQRIVPGQVVAITGSTGCSTAAHLHLEVRECFQKIKEDVLDKEWNNRYPSKKNMRFLAVPGMVIVDPFNHDQPY